MATLTVIGAGSYGTSLAIVVASKGVDVLLLARSEEKAQLLEKDRENKKYLKDIKFPETLHVTSSIEKALQHSSVILVAVPSMAFRKTIESLVPFLTSEHKICFATKGLELGSAKFLSQVCSEILPKNFPLSAISGPTFARELALNMPTAIAIAGNNEAFLDEMLELMHTKTFRIYKSDDFIGLQLGGAVKNVIAIGAGLSDGLGYGANARTALISRGLAEMKRLAKAIGATEHSLMGLSGMGDLILTCTDNQSRNRRFGMYLGQGMNADDAIAKIGQVVEGYHMSKEIKTMADKYNVYMPICSEIYEVLFNGKSGKLAARSLLEREQKKE